MFTLPIYQISNNQKLGNIDIRKINDSGNYGRLSGVKNGIFITPNFESSGYQNSIDIAEISVKTILQDQYEIPEERDGNVFKFSRTDSSRTNNPDFRSQPKEYSVTLTIVQISPPGPTTVVKIV
jgi:hypothetical protein